VKRVSRLARALLSALLLAPLPSCTSEVREAAKGPNLVVIVSDDLGYAQLSYNGSTRVATPRLDSLCREGVYFTQAYVTAPTCAPSRAGLMTGRHQARYRYESLVGPVERQLDLDVGVDTREIFLPQLLREAGYATAVIGKWHLGYEDEFHPNRRGVDYFFGFLARGRYFWDDDSKGGGDILRNEDPVEGTGYLTEVFAAEAAAFIRSHRDRPFFLYFAPWNVHVPLQVPDRYIPQGGTVMDGMVKALDDSVGVVLDALRSEGLEQNTLVVFINDNGAQQYASNAPLRGGKYGLYEGGIRVPLAMRWPGGLPSGRTFDHPVIQLDILPTLLALGGGELPDDREYDGVNLLPYLSAERPAPPHESLYWRAVNMEGDVRLQAIRVGDLKLTVRPNEALGVDRVELYDLARDRSESADLSRERPDDVRRLRQALTTWQERVTNPSQYR
jgi:arylsulfatase A-like enzyme